MVNALFEKQDKKVLKLSSALKESLVAGLSLLPVIFKTHRESNAAAKYFFFSLHFQ